MLKHFTLLTFMMAVSFISAAQSLTLPPSGNNQRSKVIQWIGPVEVSITYSSPDVHATNGLDRTGHIWGELVPYGLSDQGFGTSKAAPWRAGSNENTTISFSHDVRINGHDLKAGTYGLFLMVEKEEPWTWVFSNNSTSWGSFFYDAKEDALRVPTTPAEGPYTEFLAYGFDERLLNSTTAYLQWENKKVPLKIEVMDVNDLYISTIRNELRSFPGFDYRNWSAAAVYCAQNKINLEEGLGWAEHAMDPNIGGVADFNSLSAKAMVLLALGRENDADVTMDQAIKHPTASVVLIHQYGRSLLNAGKNEKALQVFQYNAKMHPEDKFTTTVGLARGFAAVGNKKEAIKYWETAIRNIPENQKQFISQYESELNRLKKT